MKQFLFTLCYVLVAAGGFIFLSDCIAEHRNGLAVIGGCVLVAFGVSSVYIVWKVK